MLKLKAPAKINLYLHILNKRADGFHEIETIFEKITLYDEIILRKRPQGIQVFCAHPGPGLQRGNLAYQAARLLLARTRIQAGAEISITKRIPLSSGLGGGSSDAACVLVGLNRLWGCRLPKGELLKLAARLGADVPFFLLPVPRAIGRGKGEVLTPLKLKRKNWYVLVVPQRKISTRWMYAQLRSSLTKCPGSVKIVLRALRNGDLAALDKASFNSFEPLLRRRYNQIQKIKRALKSSGAYATGISGSGPCVFGITRTRKEAMDISEKLKRKGRTWRIIVASTLTPVN